LNTDGNCIEDNFTNREVGLSIAQDLTGRYLGSTSTLDQLSVTLPNSTKY